MMFACQALFRHLFKVLMVTVILMFCLIVFGGQTFNLHTRFHMENQEVDSPPAPYNLSEEAFFDGKLCRGIEEVVGYTSIVEFGAGFGQYGRCLLRNLSQLTIYDEEDNKRFIDILDREMKEAEVYGTSQVLKSWEGYDGFENISYITDDWVKSVNLPNLFNLGRKFDWVMSLHVADYMPRRSEDIYLDNLVRHARIGIIISWCISYQPGHNSRTNDYVISQMKKRGMRQETVTQSFLRRSVASEYFRNALMAFVF